DRLDGAAALLGKPRGRAPQRRRNRPRVLAAVEHAVGQAGVVVDDADDDGAAGLARAVALGAVAVRPMPGPLELRRAEGVDVQQRAGLGPLIAAIALALGAPPA